MTFDLWIYQFCLACEKQVQSEGASYCSESCKMVDSESATLPPSSQVSFMQSTASTNDAGHLSNNAMTELRAYAVSFEQVTMQRRRSY
ncbi:hypothetical protein B0T10DRAFT_415543 [Thelonectria olida]|uniref:Uncharacterized protein n=1 Tax=Thelonectria olida TaxID=1576542 RepID=A0A9P8VVC2_9HYPO|nr:hypothetical protein B0T10DRAFT_415543 [Thelonectria olida]